MLHYFPKRMFSLWNLIPRWATQNVCHILNIWSLRAPLIARFMVPTWGPSGAGRTQVGPMLAPWTLLSGSDCSPPQILEAALDGFIEFSKCFKIWPAVLRLRELLQIFSKTTVCGGSRWTKVHIRLYFQKLSLTGLRIPWQNVVIFTIRAPNRFDTFVIKRHSTAWAWELRPFCKNPSDCICRNMSVDPLKKL